MLTRLLLFAMVLTGGIAASSQLGRHTLSSVIANNSFGAVPSAFQGPPRMSMSVKTTAGGVVDVAVSNEGTIWIAGSDGKVRFSPKTVATPGPRPTAGHSSQPRRKQAWQVGRFCSGLSANGYGSPLRFARTEPCGSTTETILDADSRQRNGRCRYQSGRALLVAARERMARFAFSHDEGRNWTQVKASDFSSIAQAMTLKCGLSDRIKP